jgi:uncharacterized protein (DUF111 family)
VFMKKGRPGYRVTVLARPQQEREMVSLLMAQSRTLGVRCHAARRTVAARTENEAAFMGEPIAQKTCRIGGVEFTKIEYESLAALARRTGRPILELAEEYIRTRGEQGRGP